MSNTHAYSHNNDVLLNQIPEAPFNNNNNNIIRNNPLLYLDHRQGAPAMEPPTIFPKHWYGEGTNEATPTCSLYMAQSSIPNSGLGIFAGKDFVEDEMVDPFPQAVIPLVDIESNPFYSMSVLSNYPWSAWSQDAQFESESVNVLYPNLGMLANSHLGLANVNQNVKGGKQVDIGSLDRAKDISTGANTLYRASTFKVSTDHNIRQGEEIFVDYGVNYFHHREKKFNMIFPTAENYQEADDIVRDFAKRLGDEITEKDEEDWKNMILKLEEDTDKIRVAYALPDSVQDVKYVAEVGTARYSIPDSMRSLEWLEENGFCLDHIRVGKSTIPYAGNGAFAMKDMKEGSVIAPMPVLPISRSLMDIRTKSNANKPNHPLPSKQLLLNYCFGHTNSSLLFFPYSSSVHFINHSHDPNAYIRWSDSDLSAIENFEKPVSQVYSGLIMEVVALRDIRLGEEVTIDYGTEWSQAWDDHVRNWDDRIASQPQEEHFDAFFNPALIAKELNDDLFKPIRTVQEQEENPYPPCIRIACHSQGHNGTYVYTVQDFENLRYCHIQNRVWKGDQYWYDAKMESSEFHEHTKVEEEDLVTDVPRYAIRFVTGEYCSDLHFQFGFRHEMGVPHDFYPDIWLDQQQDQGHDESMGPNHRDTHDNGSVDEDDDDDFDNLDDDDTYDSHNNHVVELVENVKETDAPNDSSNVILAAADAQEERNTNKEEL